MDMHSSTRNTVRVNGSDKTCSYADSHLKQVQQSLAYGNLRALLSAYMLLVTWVNVIGQLGKEKGFRVLTFACALFNFHLTLRKHKSIFVIVNILAE
jgi:hypothetical protein